ncbi:DUF5106 domain-containing protein [Bacteroidales bacterium OttesenSCG-928-B11]|nr:DUF5106 domain-containing protein [Bacteroidales bacterium OttesenSCG-928-C03]MDL2312397.1 DUF5106 domain-containing protein [Bacteroidales bacterium OttesenSCG-928-B11]
MKRIVVLLLIVFATFKISAMEITVLATDLKADSLFLYSYSDNYRWEKSYAIPVAAKMVFKSKQSLNPGMYLVATDTLSIAYIIISDQNSQKFTIKYENGETSYIGSEENTENQKYLRKMAEFQNQMQVLNVEYTALTKSEEAQEVVEYKAYDLMSRAGRLDSLKRNYQLSTSALVKGTLLSSVIRGSIEPERAPASAMASRDLFENYTLTHHFDYFPWEDARIFKTPVGVNKFRDYAYLIMNISKLKSMIFLEKQLDTLKSNPTAYFAFFDYMEKTFGDQNSPFWSQSIYLLMLRNATTLDGLPQARRLRYEKTIERLDKNNPGDIAPDFPVLLSTGETTTLHNIDAEYMILYLQNPDCPTCLEIRTRMNMIPELNAAIDDKKVTVLTIYFEQNEELWRNYLAKSANPKYMHGWDYQLQIENNHLYDTMIIPYIYLLDREKRILRKDMQVDEIEDFFKTLK